jgi:hypothetical protein
MPPIRSKATPDAGYDDRIEAARVGLASGLYTSISHAARENKVSRLSAVPYHLNHLQVARSTLSERVNKKHQSRSKASECRQKLTRAEEKVVEDWCTYSAQIAQPFGPLEIKSVACSITGKVPGKNWHHRFERRHPNLTLSIPSGLDPKRAQNFNATNISNYFDLLDKLNKDYGGIPPEQIWNMDEKGLQMGGGRKNNGRKFYHPREMKKKNVYRLKYDNLELVTVVEAISAVGESIPPSFVLSEGEKPVCLTTEIGSVATSPNGWTDRELTHNWFKDVFIPHAKKHQVKNDIPIILTVDGHDSHETDDMKETGINNNIIVLAFPSKCTHKVQPLDVGVFTFVQRRWTDHCDRRLIEGVRMDRYNIIDEYCKVRAATITRTCIQSAFRSTGIYPFNRNIFTAVDYAPSRSFSTTAYAPSSYPHEVPSSPVALSLEASSDIESESESQPASETVDEPSAQEFLSNDLPYDESSDSDFIMSDDDMPDSTSHNTVSGYVTRTSSSLVLSIDAALNRSITPNGITHDKRSREEVAMENVALQHRLQLYEKANLELQALIDSANAHCTLMQRSATTALTALENTKRKTRRSVKTGARFVTHPELKEAFEAERVVRLAKEKEAADTAAKKAVDDAARTARISQDTASKIFNQALSAYKLKDDLITVAGALELSITGTKGDLIGRIKDHLAAHPELSHNPRFTGLFGGRRS